MPFFDVNGTSLYYERSSSPGRPLVLIHEMGGSLRSWDEVVAALPVRRVVLPYDMRGHGLSEKNIPHALAFARICHPTVKPGR